MRGGTLLAQCTSKTVSTLVLLGVLATIAHASADDAARSYNYIGAASNHSEAVFVESTTVEPTATEKVFKAWTVWVESSGRFSLRQDEYDCPDNTTYALSLVLYSSNGDVAFSKDVRMGAPSHITVPESLGEGVEQWVCGTQAQTAIHFSSIDGARAFAHIRLHPKRTKSTPQSDSVPDPTAQCADGSFSYSRHRQGTCSHHGGVASWF